MVLPYDSVITREDQNYVFIVEQDGEKTKAVLSPVKVGIRVDNYQEILQGVTNGDLVIVKEQKALGDGSFVNVVSVTNEEK